MSPLATVGILSIGEMGMGIAKLLVAHNYRVVTNLEGRSQDSHDRAKNASVEVLPSDLSLVTASDYILSIVPPRDAMSTAVRISTAFNAQSSPKPTPLYFLDLNAISPHSARSIAELISSESPNIKFLDGGIIGGAPKTTSSTPPTWSKPSVPISGSIAQVPATYTHLAETLNIKHISDDVGVASGLKCCFATTTKGFTALCIQAFTTASNLGVLPNLLEEMENRTPGMVKKARGGVTGMPPKAYRWVKEMEEISETHAKDGGFESVGAGLFGEIAQVYKSVADDSVLGEEKTERRKRGLTIEDVAAAMGEGNAAKRKKSD
ncbi:putative 28.5 kDa protein in 7S RNA 5'region [Lachnellula suecica]|uniref:Putative 28.5 kDa protein in 7S RNA 5'region n=1 Tax=Lachnellula suecica TaxID=602035 RepID=A0A8T9BTZ7_9HELO|nr:putative 28.5 kDa protein in 7S RNA 5'region [Lachnellula suecica]